MRPDDVRRQLLEAGYCPIPLTGKKPVLDGWQGLREVTPDEIQWWSRTRPAATNTGVQTRLTPTLDIDILDEDIARHLLHGPQYRLVADAAQSQGELKQHLIRRARAGRHVGLA